MACPEGDPGRLISYLIFNMLQRYYNILDVTLDVANDSMW